MDTTQFTIGEMFALMRRRRNLSQNQLAKKANLSRAIVSIVESDKGNPTLKTLVAMATALDARLIVSVVEIKREDGK